MADGRDLSDDELEGLTSTLTRPQAEAVRKRIDYLSTTMRKKRAMSKLHVKDIFAANNSSSSPVREMFILYSRYKILYSFTL